MGIQWTKRAQFLIECLDLPEAASFEGARWERFQLAHLQDDATFRIENKSRQIAWSFLAAAEAMAEAVLEGRSSAFVSINLSEAAEKIRYARAVYQNLHGITLPRLVRDNQLGMALANGARLLSLPARPPRGKAQLNIYLDEFAHVPFDRQIYMAALPVISKGGRLRIGSSPHGASGIFWEIYSQALRPYAAYHRAQTPWWEVRAFCTDIATARAVAPTLPTQERVARFGTTRIQEIHGNMIAEDFAQEYECDFVDEAVAWISWEVIGRLQQLHAEAGLKWWHARSVDEARLQLPEVLRAVQRAQIEPTLCGGVDVGRTRDLTELVLVGKQTDGRLPLRWMVSLDRTPYDAQQALLEEILRTLPITQVLVDQTGLGGQLAEHLTRTGRAEGVTFTNPLKELWAVEARVQAERGSVPIPAERDLAYQIHSIKKQVTAAKNNVFDTDANERHHADKFWAWALALWAAGAGRSKTVETAASPLGNYRG